MKVEYAPGSGTALEGWNAIPHDRVRRFLSAFEVSRYCEVTRQTVVAWIESGMLKAGHLGTDRYRIAFNDLLSLLDSIGTGDGVDRP